ncbi:hypothetical protein O6H91_03G079200 [Diphasiastrum complanatum]|uniref:Uncharacterized protein n=1 Tax=Diphasiastrum complanatum TaxID=34168 RepID=A0ACC2E8D4_DIPCM|nr:hypothetical protein O6H91_03G079200 [Diphasiastrum complanatum]
MDLSCLSDVFWYTRSKGSKNRPPPLRIIKKDSQRIRKPSTLSVPLAQHRQPVIIHTYSPKTIQTDPDNFKSLVQKLTGRSIESGFNDRARDDFVIDSTALQAPAVHCANASSHSEVRQLDQANEGISISPRSPLKSPASFSHVFASPQLWSSLPSPYLLSQQFLSELPSLSPGIQGPTNNLLSIFPGLFPDSRYSDGTIASPD